MNDNERTPLGPERAGDGELPDALRWQLRALRRDQPPSRDLWSGIAARLGEQAPAGQAEPTAATAERSAPAAVAALPRRSAAKRGWMAPLALAASVAALAIGLSAHFRAQGPMAPADGGYAAAPAAASPAPRRACSSARPRA